MMSPQLRVITALDLWFSDLSIAAAKGQVQGGGTTSTREEL